MAKDPHASLKKSLMKACVALEERYGQRKPPIYEDLFTSCTRSSNSGPATLLRRSRINEEYVDWNDMRVATVREIQDILGLATSAPVKG